MFGSVSTSISKKIISTLHSSKFRAVALVATKAVFPCQRVGSIVCLLATEMSLFGLSKRISMCSAVSSFPP